MGEIKKLKKSIKLFISRHALICLWSSRLLACLYGLKSIPYRYGSNFKTYIDRHVKVTGWSNITIGDNSVIAAGSWLNVNDRNGARDSLRIGENCFIGRNNFITVGQRVSFGDYCLTASNCSFIGSSHNINNPNMPYITTGVDICSDIEVGSNCFFGFGVMVLGPITIGHGSVIGAGSVVLSDIPPFSVVIGNPARVIKRFSFVKNCWVNVENYVEEKIVTETEYRKILHGNVGYTPLPISAASSFLGDV